MPTAIEDLVARADAEPGKSGYHVRAMFVDGSRIDAPILRHGTDWAEFDEIVEHGGLHVDLAGAVLQIEWAPGAAEAEGPRFSNLSRRSALPHP